MAEIACFTFPRRAMVSGLRVAQDADGDVSLFDALVDSEIARCLTFATVRRRRQCRQRIYLARPIAAGGSRMPRTIFI